MLRHEQPSGFVKFRRTLSFLAVLLVLGGSAAAQNQSYPYRSGEILIKFAPGASAVDIAAVEQSLGATRIADFTSIGASHQHITRLSVDQAIARYRGDSRIQYIEPNYVVHALLTPNDSLFSQMWGLRNTGQTGGTPGADIHAPQAWDLTTGSPSILVAMIDTGIDYNHPDLAANIFVNPGEIPGNGIDDDGNGFVDDVHGWDFFNHDADPWDDHGHGTHTAGTVGAIGNNTLGVVGVDWHVRLLPLKFLGADGSGTTADAVSAIQYATRMGARVMSNSWGGGPYSQALYDAIQAAGAAGIAFVAAAGNSASNNDASPAYPASYDLPNIISVAASDANDNLASFSNYGATSVDLAAPGTGILSTLPGGNYGFYSGTSMATPHVAGAMALIMARFPGIDAMSAKNLLLARVDLKPAFAGKVLTGGRLNAFLALAEPDSIPPAAITDLSVATANGDWAELHWTATGDDGSAGRAVRYDVRYSTTPITAATFSSATAAHGMPEPQASGAPEQFRVYGLSFSTGYYFAVEAFDELGNSSPISNVPSATTLGAPSVGTSPDSLTADLLTGAKSTETLTITNSGASELRFNLSEDRVAGSPSTRPPAPPTKPGPALASLKATRATGGAVLYSAGHDPGRSTLITPLTAVPSGVHSTGLRILLLNSAGSVSEMQNLLAAFPDVAQVDAFDAYQAVPTLDQLRAYNTVIVTNGYPFGDRAAIGNVLADYVDAGGGLVLTLASFIQYWEIDGRLRDDGYIPFTLGSGPDGSSTLGTFEPAHPIMQGVHVASGDVLGVTTVAPGGQLVASWANGQPFVATNDRHVVGINIYFAVPGYWGGDLPLILHNAALWAGGAAKFLSMTPDSGAVMPGQSAQVQVTFDAARLDGGDYRSNIGVHSNDPIRPAVLVPAHLHVTGAPDIAVSPASLEYGPRFIGATIPETLTVINQGTDLLSVSVAISPGDYSAPTAGFDLAPRTSKALIVTFSPQSVAVIPGTLTLTSNDPDQPTLAVPLHGEGLVAPDIAVTPDSFSVALLTNQTAQRTLVIQNTGGSDLTFTVGTQAILTGPMAVSGAQPRAPETGVGGRPALLTRASPRGAVGTGIASGGGSGTVLSNVGASPPRAKLGTSAAPVGPNSIGVANDILVLSTTYVEPSILRALQELGRGYDIIYTETFTGIDFTPYRTIVVAMDGGLVEAASCQALANAAKAGRLLFMVGGTNYPPYYSGVGSYLLSHTGVQGWSISAAPHLLVTDATDPLAKGLPASTTFNDVYAAYYMLRISDPAAKVAARNGDGHPALVHKPMGSGNLVYLIDTPYGGVWGDASDYAVLKQIVENALNLAPVGWLAVTPSAGTVPPGGQMSLQVGFDATGLFGGDYRAAIQITSNDPNESPLAVPAHLHVTGVPDIAVSPASLEYGPRFIGATIPETLTVINQGTDLLSISAVTTSGDYSAPTAGFDLAPRTSKALIVTFSPQSVAVIPGTLTLTSNDPDQPTLVVPLHGEGLVAPDIAVTPDSFSVALLTNQTAQRTLVIQNTGGSDLTFTVGTQAILTGPMAVVGARARARGMGIGGRPARMAGGAGSAGDLNNVGASSSRAKLGASAAPVRADSMGVANDILVLSTTYIDASVLKALQELGRSYDIIYTYDFTAIDFTPYRTIIVAMDGGGVEAASCQALANATSAGRLVFMLGGTAYSPYYNGVASYLLSHTGVEGWVVSSAPHLVVTDAADPLARGLAASTTFVDPAAAYYMLRINDPAARVVARNGDGYPVLVHKSIGSGTLVYLTDAPYSDYWNNPGDYAVLKQIVENVLLSRVAWLTVEPNAGTVPAGGQMSLQVGFDATGLFGGDYRAAIRITSNDPNESPLDVPAHLHVTGVPDIAVSPASLEYGRWFIGYVLEETLQVTNHGTDVLDLTGVSAAPGDYSAPGTPFSLAPGESRRLTVTFSPQSVGVIPGTLTLTSNDPDQPTLVVPLHGEGLVAPNIAVTPDSFSVVIAGGDSAQRTLVIQNTGGSDLTFTAVPSLAVTTGPMAVFGSRARALGTGLGGGAAMSAAGASPGGISRAGAVAEVGAGKQLSSVGASSPQAKLATGATRVGPDSMGVANDILVLATNYIDTSLLKALQELGRGYDIVYTYDFTTIDFTPYRTIIVAMDGGGVEAASCQALANATSAGRLVFMLGGTAYGPYYNGVGSYLLSHTGVQGWTTSAATHVGVIAPTDPLAMGLPASKTFANWNASFYMLRINDPAAKVVASNGDGYPVLVHKSIGAGNLVYFIDTPYGGYWTDPGDYAEFKQIVKNALGLAAPTWLSVIPGSGTVAAGGQMSLGVGFITVDLEAGDYPAAVRIGSNDPDQPEVAVPVHLHVVAVPRMVVSPASLEFGSVYMGGSMAETLLVTNRGLKTLSVTGVSLTPGDYSAPTAPFDVARGTTRSLVVTFSPQSVAVIPGTLTLTSNDPLQPTLAVPLHGEGLVPPSIGVTPASMNVSLFRGRKSTVPITIANTGGSGLSYSVSVVRVSSPIAAGAVHVAGSAEPPVARAVTLQPQGNAAPEMSPVRSRPEAGVALTGASLRLDVLPGSPLENQATSFIVFTDNMEHGNNGWTRQVYGVDDLWHQTTRDHFSPYRSWWCGIDSSGVYDTGRAIRTAVVSPAIDLRQVNAPITLQFYERFDTQPGRDFCMVDVSSNAVTWTPLRGRIGSASSGRTNWRITNLDLSAWSGQIINIRFYFDTVDEKENSLPGWFFDDVTVKSDGLQWLYVLPAVGTVPPSGSQQIQATFDATGLAGGDYAAEIEIKNNDPLQPVVAIPAQLHVSNAALISVSKSSVDFGQVFQGYTARDTIVISAGGGDSLRVSSITVVNPAFRVSSGGFVLPVGGSRALVVSYRATALGVANGSVTILSNDPTRASITIPLRAENVQPPIASVTPDTLKVILPPGEVRLEPIGLDNFGGSPLLWNLEFETRVNSQLVMDEVPAGSTRATAAGSGARAASRLSGRSAPASSAGSAGALPHGPAKTRVAASPPALAYLLDRLNVRYSSLTSLIPGMSAFVGGDSGVSIASGGGMFQIGNLLSTDLGGPISYSNNSVVTSPAFGGGAYFTRKYTGLFVLAADLVNVQSFSTNGHLGAGGTGVADGAIFTMNVEGAPYRAFVKRVHDTILRSVNHIILVPDVGAPSHVFSTDTHLDDDSVTGIGSATRVYYLLFATESGGYVSDDDMIAIINAFLAAVSPPPGWMGGDLLAGTLAAQSHADLVVRIDSHDLDPGEHLAQVLVHSNDPVNPTVALPVVLTVEDGITATEVSLVSSSADPGKVQVVWYSAAGASLSAEVYRRSVNGAWTLLGPLEPDGQGYLRFEDTNIVAGNRYGYRLRITRNGNAEFLGETWVDVPLGARFALQGMLPNPAGRDLTVAFSLPDEQPAMLELLDLAGRRLISRSVGGFGAGRHLVPLGRGEALPSGLYMVRLHRGDQMLMVKCIVMQ